MAELDLLDPRCDEVFTLLPFVQLGVAIGLERKGWKIG